MVDQLLYISPDDTYLDGGCQSINGVLQLQPTVNGHADKGFHMDNISSEAFQEVGLLDLLGSDPANRITIRNENRHFCC